MIFAFNSAEMAVVLGRKERSVSINTLAKQMDIMFKLLSDIETARNSGTLLNGCPSFFNQVSVE